MYWIAIGALIFFFHIIKSAAVGVASYPGKVEATQRADRNQYLRSRLLDDALEAQMKKEVVDERLFDHSHKQTAYFAPFVYGPDFVPEYPWSYDCWWYMGKDSDKPYVMVKMAKRGKLVRQYICHSGVTDPVVRGEFERLMLAVEEELNKHNPDIPITAVIDMSQSYQYHICTPLREYVAEHGYGTTKKEWAIRWQDRATGVVL